MATGGARRIRLGWAGRDLTMRRACRRGPLKTRRCGRTPPPPARSAPAPAAPRRGSAARPRRLLDLLEPRQRLGGVSLADQNLHAQPQVVKRAAQVVAEPTAGVEC